jgi:hypothetical protein
MPRKRRSAVATTDPAERPLTPRQQRLVDIALAAGSEGRHLTRMQLGEAAGYGKGEVARTTAVRTLALPNVRAAIINGIREQAQGDAADAYATLRFVARKARSTRDRITAAKEVLGLAGVVGDAAHTGPGVTIQFHFAHMRPEDCRLYTMATPEQRAAATFQFPGDGAPRGIEHAKD